MTLICPLTPKHTEHLYDETTHAALCASLVPFDKATNGDLICVGIGLRLPAHSINPKTHGTCTFHFHHDDGPKFARYRELLQVQPQNCAKYAHLGMICESDKYFDRAAETAVKAMAEQAGEDSYFDAYLFSDGMLITRSDVEWAIESDAEDGVFSLEEADMFVHLVLPPITSAHEKVAATLGIEEMMRAATFLSGIKDEDGSTVQLTCNMV